MVEENSDDVTIKMGFGTIRVDATIDNLEEVLAPIFRDLDEARLFRIAQGDEARLSAVADHNRRAVQLIAEYWWQKKEDSQAHTAYANCHCGCRCLSLCRDCCAASLIACYRRFSVCASGISKLRFYNGTALLLLAC